MSIPLTKEQQIKLAWAEHQAAMPGHRVGLTAALRTQLCEQQNWRCCYCGNRMDGTGSADDAPSFEHVVPRSLGGTNALANLVIACRRCNGERGSEILEVHLLVEDHDVAD